MFCCNTKVAAINICFSVRVLVQSVVHNIHGTNYIFVVCIFVFLPVVFPYGSADTTGVKLVGLLDINGNNSGDSKNCISWATCKSAPCSR